MQKAPNFFSLVIVKVSKAHEFMCLKINKIIKHKDVLFIV